MGSKSSVGGEQARVDWPQLILVILAILGLAIAASMAAGFAGEQTPGEDLLEGVGEDHGEPDPDEQPPVNDNGEDPPNGETENGDDPVPGDDSTDDAEENGEDWDPDDSIIAAHDATGIHHDDFSELSEEIVFEVYTEEPAYWRITAYDAYTGQGWERSDDIERNEEIYAPEHRGDLIQEIVPKVETHAVPAAWQPLDFGGAEQEPYFDEMNGLRVDEPVEPVESGRTQFGIHSLLPVTDEALLTEAGTDYPEHIEARYLQQPAEVPERVTEKTNNITADAETPYETAAIIAYWLRTNNNYSLDVPPPEGEITDEVLFERDEAYCAYFATAMTNMLRTQDIPARYVTGYGPGEFDEEENRAVVRAMNAHAWVEVYFPGYGWVPFEPTPADDRSETIEEETDEGEDSLNESDPTDDESLEETIELIDGLEPEDLDESVDADEEEGQEQEDIPEEYDVELPDEIIPGETITATVTRDGEPVSGATVQFNGETIGETDDAGDVSGEVPFVEELNVTVIPPNDAAGTVSAGSASRLPSVTSGLESLNRTVPTDGDFTITIEAVAIPEKEVPLHVTIENNSVPEAEIRIDDEFVGTTDTDGYLTLELPNEEDEIDVTAKRGELVGTKPLEIHPIAINVDDPPIVGSTVTATVSAGDEPIPDAIVVVGNTEVGETDESGQVDIPLPETERQTTLGVTYAEVYEEISIEVTELSVDIDERPMAGKSVTVNATVGGEPLQGATIVIDGSEAGETGGGGTLETSLPDTTDAIPLELDYQKHQASTELDVKPVELERLDEFSFPLKTSEFAVTWNEEPVSNATIAFGNTEMGTTDSDGLVTARVPITSELVVNAEMNGATAEITIDGLLYKIAGVLLLPLVLLGGLSYWQRHRFVKPAGYLRVFGHHLIRIVAILPRQGLDLLVTLGRWIDRIRERGLLALVDAREWIGKQLQAVKVMVPRYVTQLKHAITSFDLAELRGIFTAIRGWFTRKKSRSKSKMNADNTHNLSDADQATRERAITVRMVWDRFVATVRPPRMRTKTPGEIKRYAINRGFPQQPVETIVELFRDIEYGKQQPTETDISQAEQALETTKRESNH